MLFFKKGYLDWQTRKNSNGIFPSNKLFHNLYTIQKQD
jgi:hypothetical protein